MSDSQCNAPFAGDSDIGGIGVLTSFLVFASVTTIAIALNIHTPPIPFRRSVASWYAAEVKVKHDQKFIMASMSDRGFWLHQFSCSFLASLCQIQLLTSIGILLAGWIRIKTLSMYHLTLVWDYWWLTFTAFWAVSTQDKQPRRSRFGWLRQIFDRERIGTLLMIVSVSLSIAYQIFVYDYFQNDWDEDTSGMCFRYCIWCESGDPFLLWLIVVCIFWLQLVFSLSKVADEYMMKIDPWLANLERRLVSTHWTLMECLTGTQQLPLLQNLKGSPRKYCGPLVIGLLATTNSLAFLLLWSARQFLGILGVTDGTRVVGFPLYIFYFFQTVADVVTLKILNKPLVSDESTWGFGQILPMALILSLGFQIRDSVEWADEKAEERTTFLKETDVDVDDEGYSGQGRTQAAQALLPPVKFARPFVGSLYAQAQAIEDRSGHTV